MAHQELSDWLVAPGTAKYLAPQSPASSGSRSQKSSRRGKTRRKLVLNPPPAPSKPAPPPPPISVDSTESLATPPPPPPPESPPLVDAFAELTTASEPPSRSPSSPAKAMPRAPLRADAQFARYSRVDFGVPLTDGQTVAGVHFAPATDAFLRQLTTDVLLLSRPTADVSTRVRMAALCVSQRVPDVSKRAVFLKYVADKIPVSIALIQHPLTKFCYAVVPHKSGDFVVDLGIRVGMLYGADSSAAAMYKDAFDARGIMLRNPFLDDRGDYVETDDIDHGSEALMRTMEPVDLTEKLDMQCKLGAGSFGDVWRVSLAGFTCAVKILRTSKMSTKERAQVVQEVQVLQHLDHPNIVRYLGREVRANDDLLILMEFVPHSLHDAVRRARKGQRRRFQLQEAAHVIGEVARGLNYMHTLQIPVMHRDLKGKNVLVEWDDESGERISRVKLCDFGVAKALTDSTVADSFVGTTRWMAPEVVRLLFSMQGLGEGSVAASYTPKADIWSLGMILFELIECTIPYVEVSQWDVKAFIAKGIIPSFTNADHSMDPLVALAKLCLQLEPRHRPTAKEFLFQLVI